MTTKRPLPPPVRCRWCESTPLYRAYHDREWGVPVHSDRRWFEMLVLDAALMGADQPPLEQRRDEVDPRH